MEVVAIVSRKGGVGKTATAQALGAGLIRYGYRVLLIDLDSQTNLSYGTGADLDAPNSMDVLTGKVKAADAIQETAQGDIIVGTEGLAGADAIITGNGKEYRLKEALRGLPYDYVIIDTPAQIGLLTVNAMAAAKNIVIPVQADIYSLQGLGQLNKSIEAVRDHCNKDLHIRGILITRYNSRAVISKDMQSNFADVAKSLGTRLYKAPIRECVSIKEAQACQQDIFTFAPRSNAAQDYQAFIEQFKER